MMKKQNNYLYNKRLHILNFAKIIVSKQGFQPDLLKVISNEYKLDKNQTNLLFPEGNNALIKFAFDQLNIELENYCKKMDLIRLPIHKRIRKILLSKILLIKKDKIFYKKLFFNLLIPKKQPSLTSQLYKSVDQMWFIAGDTSVDFNFYSKRIILAGIYSRVILFFFNNNDQSTLEKNLDADLKKVSKIPELKSKVNIVKDYFPNIIKFVKNFS